MSVVLSEHLPLLASAPDGIQKLRGLILELAVRGKLVPQEPDRDQSTWKRGLFSEFFSLEYGDNLPAPKRTGTGEYPVYGSNGVVGTHNECRVLAPCIVVGRKGSAGALNLCREPGCWVTDVAYYCIPPNGVDLDFAFVLLRTLGLDDLGKGIKPGLSRSEAYSLSVEIPPLAEQHRIVAKVDELMALCDRLEAEQTDAATAHARIVETLLGTLTQSTDAADLAANWQRLAGHFDVLFTTEASIEALKQTVLQLAVMGKLVPQSPENEPACDLVARILEERAFRDASKKVSKQVVPAEVLDGPFALPSSWKWVPIGAILDVTSSKRIFESDYVPDGIPFYRSKEIGELSKKGATSANFYISEEKYREVQKARDFPKEGDLLLTSVGSIGNTWIVDDRRFYFKDGNITQIIQNDLVSMPYLQRFIQGPVFMRQATDTVSGTAYNALTIIKIKQMLLPLPPLKEQYRIVTKIDELMGLCDQLRAYLTTARQREARLADALIESALEAA